MLSAKFPLGSFSTFSLADPSLESTFDLVFSCAVQVRLFASRCSTHRQKIVAKRHFASVRSSLSVSLADLQLDVASFFRAVRLAYALKLEEKQRKTYEQKTGKTFVSPEAVMAQAAKAESKKKKKKQKKGAEEEQEEEENEVDGADVDDEWKECRQILQFLKSCIADSGRVFRFSANSSFLFVSSNSFLCF
jgi:hypothetical protein